MHPPTMTNVEIPYGCYWSTPFAKWQGTLQHLNSVQFAAWVSRKELRNRSIDPQLIDYGVLGTTIPQSHSFYGLPWLTGLAGFDMVTGPTISQACATGTRCLLAGQQEVQSELANACLIVTADRCSNGPHLYYPDPYGPGGTGTHENWVLDNFSCDPLGRHSMLQTAENVARKHAISTNEQHDVVLLRLEQYQRALADDRAFQKRFMSLPFEVPNRTFRKCIAHMDGDEGIFQSTRDGLSKLNPLIEGGTVTHGGQTHPADGNASMIVASSKTAMTLSRDSSIKIELAGFGQARVSLAYMPEAVIPATLSALNSAGIGISDLSAVKTHNPFAVNDILLARETGFPLERMNLFGCSLVWGHPQGPTALRSIIELIEELVQRGGGFGLFSGCAAGDSAMALVIKVSSR